jgi:hypothetical protein
VSLKIDGPVKSSWNALCASVNDNNFSIKSGDYNLIIYKSNIPFKRHSGGACAGLDPVAGIQ